MASIVQVTLHTADAVSENFITNTFAVTGDVATVPDSELLRDAFDAFYSSLVSPLFPGVIARDGHDFKIYIAGGAKPNYPLYEDTFDLASTPTGAGLPSEVAVCLSFQGTRTPGFPQARRRGRVYLGPLKTTVADANARPSASTISSISSSAQTLWDAIDAITSAGTWAVWSPTDSAAVAVTNGWIDNAFDTQRSRGIRRTQRNLFNFL